MTLPDKKEALKSEYNAWLNKNQLQYKESISNAIDAIYNIQLSDEVSSTDLNALRAGLELPHTFSYALGEHCCRLALRHTLIEELILTVSRHALATTRFNILILCFYNQPESMADTILENGLNDKSKKVRQKAIDIICRTNKRCLKDHIMLRLQHERDNEIVAELEMAYGLMDKGYARCAYISDRIAIQLPDGGQTTLEVASIDINDVVVLEKPYLISEITALVIHLKYPTYTSLKNELTTKEIDRMPEYFQYPRMKSGGYTVIPEGKSDS